MGSYLSYAEQAGRYFGRSHEAPLREPLEAAAAWRGPDVAGSDDWRFRLGATEVEELCAAVAHAKRAGKATGELTAADFPLPTLGAAVDGWRDELQNGRGFQVVSGVPTETLGQEDSELLFWCLGLHLGRPGAQNPQGDLLGHVTDTGDDSSDPFVRLYRTASNIAYHCDAADVVGLLCLKRAKKGGASRIVSSVAVYNELLARRPDLVDRLYEPFLLDVRNEDSKGELRYLPIPPCRHAEGRLRTFYHSDYFRSVQRFDDVPEFSADERALLDLYEEIAASRIVSSVAVYNELLARRPDLVDRLYEPFLLDVRNEDSKGELRYLPIPPCRHAEGRLRTFYHSDYFRSVQRFDDVPEFSADERALLDLYEEIAASPALYFDMDLDPGDIQWLSNHVILHARTAYEDHEDPAEKRHLLRLWLSIE